MQSSFAAHRMPWPRRLAGWLLIAALAAAGLGAGMTAGPERAAAQAAPVSDGLVCTTRANNTFTLRTLTGYVGTPDDNVVFMWGLAEPGAPFQHPGPVLCVTEGQTVTVILQNTLPENVSLVFPGQVGVTADGQPAQPQFDTSGTLVSLTKPAAANGGSVTYSFVASRPGTFVYQSGTNPAKQVNMGLFGALVVRPARGAGYAYATGDNQFNPATEYLVLLSEIDPVLNQAVERGRPFNLANFKPRYYMINGRGFPDSIAPNYASWLPTQPYGALARIHPYDATANPLPALVRYANVASEDMPFHPHGNHGRVVGRDGFPLLTGANQDLSFEKFTVNVGPGQTWDVTFNWRDAEAYSPANPVPVTVPDFQTVVYGMFYSGSPYLGLQGPLPVGQPMTSQCGEYYIIAHNHALFQLNSWGAVMTGPVTYLRVDPPLPNTCGQ